MSMSGHLPLAVTIADAARMSGRSVASINRLLADGTLTAVKAGASTLILVPVLQRYLASLPPARYRAPRPPGGARTKT